MLTALRHRLQNTLLRRLSSQQNIANVPWPTVFHITHHKAGSQWVHAILHTLAYHHLVLPEVDVGHFFKRPIEAHKIYPTLYITYQEFMSVTVPQENHKFVIIRDLRDTLVSLYYSLKYSHKILKDEHRIARDKLNQLNLEEGLEYLMNNNLKRAAFIQWSWWAARERIYRYEDLLQHDEGLFEEIFIKVCRLPVTRQQVREAVRTHRFENRTNGRPRGTEDIYAHERKGVAGDWKNHFTPKIKNLFKWAYGSVLIATGYEKDFNW